MDCGRCFKCKEGTGCIRTISFSAEAMPNRKPETVRINRTDKQWDRDMPAYRRLRQNGIQPPRIDDSSELEGRASDQLEVEMGKIIPKDIMPKVKEGMAISKELQVGRPASVQVPNEA